LRRREPWPHLRKFLGRGKKNHPQGRRLRRGVNGEHGGAFPQWGKKLGERQGNPFAGKSGKK